MNKSYIDGVLGRFDKEFPYLPPKDGKPMYMVSSRVKMIPQMLEDGQIIATESGDIVPLDNKDVRAELIAFLKKELSDYKQVVLDEVAGKVTRLETNDLVTDDPDRTYTHNAALGEVLSILKREQ